MKKIRLLHSDEGDWVGLYIDRKLVAEGHSIGEYDMVKLLVPDAELKQYWDTASIIENSGGKCPLELPRYLD